MVNFWAIIVCAILNLVVGAFWYSSFLFGKIWMEYAGITAATMSKFTSRSIFSVFSAIFIGALVMAYVLNYFIFLSQAFRISQGLTVGFTTWLGFVAMTHLGSVLFEKRPAGYFWITTGYYLFVMLIDSMILAVWR